MQTALGFAQCSSVYKSAREKYEVACKNHVCTNFPRWHKRYLLIRVMQSLTTLKTQKQRKAAPAARPALWLLSRRAAALDDVSQPVDAHGDATVPTDRMSATCLGERSLLPSADAAVVTQRGSPPATPSAAQVCRHGAVKEWPRGGPPPSYQGTIVYEVNQDQVPNAPFGLMSNAPPPEAW